MVEDKKYTAFIFARGGSKGVHRKNIREVAGKPLISHSIDTALKSKYINRVIVSTDCTEIKKVSKEYGAEIIDRPGELATDSSAEILSWKHAVEEKEETLGNLFISLPATTPLRSVKDINGAIERFFEFKNDVLFGVTNSHSNPYLNMVKINNSNCLEVVNKDKVFVRRQDVPKVYDVVGLYVGDTNYIKKTENIMDGNVGYYEIPQARSLDIDTEFDLYLADLILSNPFRNDNV